MSEIKQVVILAGGKGTRMREMTEDLPKPMVQIGNRPVLEHLIDIYDKYGNFNYLICSGYLGEKSLNTLKTTKKLALLKLVKKLIQAEGYIS